MEGYSSTLIAFNTKSQLCIALASYPGPFEKSEKKAWYPLFAHALN